jgi:hypothetical protein
LLAGGAILLVGQYLSWAVQRVEPISNFFGGQGGPSVGLPNLFTSGDSVTGWAADSVLSTILLLLLALVAVARPEVSDKLPLGFALLATCLFVAADGLGVRRYADLVTRETGEHFRVGRGVFVTLIGLAVCVAAVAALRFTELMSLDRSALLVQAIGVGLLVSLFLPWQRFSAGSQSTTSNGFDLPASAVLIVLVLALVTRMHMPGRGPRLVLAAAALVVVLGMFSPTLGFVRASGTWIGLGLAIVLVVLALDGAWRGLAIDWARVWPYAVPAGAAMLLFLPWEHVCSPTAVGRPVGGCLAYHGWSFEPGIAIGMFALLWALGLGAPAVARVEVALLAAILVSTVGFEVSPVRKNVVPSLAWGAVVTYVATGLLVALVLGHAAMATSLRGRLYLRLVPLAVCVAYLAVVAVPWWHVLPFRVDEALQFGSPSWLSILGVAAAIRLARSWWEPAPKRADVGWLTFLPLFLFGTAAAVAVEAHHEGSGIGWGGGTVIVLAGLLAVMGWIEEHGGLERLEVPEILRIDRI